MSDIDAERGVLRVRQGEGARDRMTLLSPAVLLILYAAWVNWASVLLGAATGASRLTPIAGAGHRGPAWAEAVVAFGLVSISIAMVIGVGLVVWGLLRRAPGAR